MKKVLSLIFVLMFVVSFAACGNKNETPASNDSDVVTDTETETEELQDEDVLTEDSESDEIATEEGDDKAETKPENKPETKPENKPETKPETKPEEKPETNTENNGQKTLGNSLLAEFKSVASSGNALSVAEKLASSQTVSALSMGAISVEPGYLNGFDNTEITGFSEGAMFCPMIGSIPFVGYVFTLEDGTDASAFISNLKNSANLRWNICTEAEEMVAGASGNKVFFVMCNKSLEE